MLQGFPELHKESIDTIIPVPLHTKRFRQRGFNQADLLAQCVSDKTGIPVDNNLLKRVKDIPQQSVSKTSEELGGKWKCQICGYIYDPIKGDPDSGITPGTPFREIPENWHCPICGALKSQFTKI